MEFHVVMSFVVALVIGMFIEAFFGPLNGLGFGA
jgi:hypothetical protein